MRSDSCNGTHAPLGGASARRSATDGSNHRGKLRTLAREDGRWRRRDWHNPVKESRWGALAREGVRGGKNTVEGAKKVAVNGPASLEGKPPRGKTYLEREAAERARRT